MPLVKRCTVRVLASIDDASSSSSGTNSPSSSGQHAAPGLPATGGLNAHQGWMPRLQLPFGRPSAKADSAKGDAASTGGTGGGTPGSGGGGGGGGGGDGGGDGGEEDDEILNEHQVEALAKERNVSVPADMLQVAKQYGLRASALTKFFALQSWPMFGWLVRSVPALRDRLIADNKFLFKVLVELVIDSGCVTVAEVRKRGDKFWEEFEFFLSDMWVGLVLDVALVSLMAPVAVIGGGTRAAMASTGLQKALANIPSAFFAASLPGVSSYTIGQRLACLAVKFGEYSLAGISCGLIGQSICNALMNWRRSHVGTKEDDVAVPPLFKTALVWGLFMGVSSNLRYQTVFGIEALVDMTIAKRVPQVAYAATVAIRFCNNVIGGENFIDMARWAGVQ